MNEANRGCSQYRKQAVMMSYHCVDTYCGIKDYLFACKQPA